jgi:hypothetical protein
LKLRLTEAQVRALLPYFDRVWATAVTGSPGMLVAQLRHDTHHDVYTMEPAFLPHEFAKLISEKGEKA